MDLKPEWQKVMKEMKVSKINYDGCYPNLCSGILTVTTSDNDGNEKEWIFPNFCMKSGGSVSFNDEMDELVDCGEWSISEFPDGFPEDLEQDVEKMVNQEVECGCCGGCV